MGFPFTLGIRLITSSGHREVVPWAWAMNGYGSVLAAVGFGHPGNHPGISLRALDRGGTLRAGRGRGRDPARPASHAAANPPANPPTIAYPDPRPTVSRNRPKKRPTRTESPDARSVSSPPRSAPRARSAIRTGCRFQGTLISPRKNHRFPQTCPLRAKPRVLNQRLASSLPASFVDLGASTRESMPRFLRGRLLVAIVLRTPHFLVCRNDFQWRNLQVVPGQSSGVEGGPWRNRRRIRAARFGWRP